MANPELDEDLKLFIRSVIPSVWALELLLFMRAHADRPWTHEALARETRSHTNLAREVVAHFTLAGLVAAREDGCVYWPAAQVLDELAGKLAAAYRDRPVTVINAITASRTDNLKQFADAFRLRGDRRK